MRLLWLAEHGMRGDLVHKVGGGGRQCLFTQWWTLHRSSLSGPTRGEVDSQRSHLKRSRMLLHKTAVHLLLAGKMLVWERVPLWNNGDGFSLPDTRSEEIASASDGGPRGCQGKGCQPNVSPE
jgi:hypothetical protein